MCRNKSKPHNNAYFRCNAIGNYLLGPGTPGCLALMQADLDHLINLSIKKFTFYRIEFLGPHL